MKIAFATIPKAGGTFTFYRNLRGPLLREGIDLRCVSVGKREASLWEDAYADEGCVLLAGDESDIKRQARAFSRWCDEEGVDVVFGVNSVAILSALPHLSPQIRIMARCANAFDHGYRITMSGRERLCRIVALAPRQIDDLVEHYGADREKIVLIPNGTSRERFDRAASNPRGTAGQLRLGFLGRLEHKQKGVLFIPEILRSLKRNGTHYSLTIAGEGIHEQALMRELREDVDAGLVRFVGPVGYDGIADFLADIDVFLFPSQFEGSPNALIEALMAGCVPAAWTLRGITDFVIREKRTGILAERGDGATLADAISRLADDVDGLREMSMRASADARERFSRERVAGDYVKLFTEVMRSPPVGCQSKPWGAFRVDPAFVQPAWKRVLPGPLKSGIKRLVYRSALMARRV